jgi:hypothetical protein
MNEYHYTNGLGIVYSMYGNIGAFVDRESSLTKPRKKRFSKRKFSWAIKYLFSCIL